MSELEIWNELGNIYNNAGACEQAVHAYTKAIEAGSASWKTFSKLISIYIQKEAYQEAVEACRKGIELLPAKADQARLWKRLGDLKLGLDEYEESISAYQVALNLDPDNPVLKEFLNCAVRAAKETAPLVAAVGEKAGTLPATEVVDLSPAASEPEEFGTEPVQDSPEPEEPEAAESNEDLVESGAEFIDEPAEMPSIEEAEEEEPSLIVESMPVAMEAVEQEPVSEPAPKEPRNRRVISRMEEPVRSRAQALLKLGLLRWCKNDYESALQFLQTALNLAAVFSDAHFEALCFYAIGRLQVDLNRPAEAICAYENAAALDPEDIFPWSKLGALYSRADRYDDALAAFKKSIEYNSQDPVSWNGIADVYAKLGRIEEAISAYQLSNTLERLTRDDDAIAMVQMASECDGETPRILEEMGNINFINGSYREAVEAYTTAIEFLVEPAAKAALWKRVGDARSRLHEPEAANAAYYKAHELDPVYTSPVTMPVPAHVEEETNFPAEESEVEELSFPADLAAELETMPAEAEAAEAAYEMAAEPIELNEGNDEEESAPAKVEEESVEPVEEPVEPQTAPEEDEEEAPYWIFRTTAPIVPPARKTVEAEPQPAGFTLSNASTPVASKPAPEFILPKFTAQPNVGTAPLEGTLEDPTMLLVEKKTGGDDTTEKTDISNSPASETEQALYGFASEKVETAESRGATRETPPAQPDPVTLRNDVATYKRVTEINPNNDRAWDALGNIYEAMGLHSEAINAFEKAISLASQREVYHYHLGLAYAAQKRYDKAIQSLQKVVALNPDYLLAHCALAGYYRRVGREAEAKEHIAIARPRIQNENDYNQACFESICGNIELSLNYLKKAMANKQADMDLVRNDPDLDFIRTDPRFEALVAEQLVPAEV